MAIRVALVEDHPEIRQGISYNLNSSALFNCTVYASAEEAIEMISDANTDVVLMDIQLPGLNGIESTRSLRDRFPLLPIMMCTAYEDDDSIFKALEAGAKGYILKRAAGNMLMDAIEDLARGGSPMSSTIARKVVESFQRTKAQANVLTSRENEILDLLAQGFRNKEIAEKLFVSVNTIRTHVYHIYEKLQVQNRVEALVKTGRTRI